MTFKVGDVIVARINILDGEERRGRIRCMGNGLAVLDLDPPLRAEDPTCGVAVALDDLRAGEGP